MSWSYEQSEVMKGFAKEMGVEYLDCDTAEIRSQLNLDTSKDYYDQGHMNLSGSIKLSQWFGAYLDNTYDLPDHRDDDTFQRWNEDYQVYAERTKE
jgi:hypothetical protein